MDPSFAARAQDAAQAGGRSQLDDMLEDLDFNDLRGKYGKDLSNISMKIRQHEEVRRNTLNQGKEPTPQEKTFLSRLHKYREKLQREQQDAEQQQQQQQQQQPPPPSMSKAWLQTVRGVLPSTGLQPLSTACA